jgi:hypothetical protein
MPSTPSSSLRLELIGNGEQSGLWGQTTNINLGTLLEEAICGNTTITMTNVNYTLTAYNYVVDESRSAVIVATGTNAAIRDIIAPLVKKLYVIKNSTTGGYAINIRGSSGTAVLIPNGSAQLVVCDGINFYAAAPATGAIPAGLISLWSGSIASIPAGWLLCDGTSGTPDLRDRFIVGVGTTYAVAATGGSADAVVVSHTHTASTTGTVNITSSGESAVHTHIDSGHSHGLPVAIGIGVTSGGTAVAISGSSATSAGSANLGSQTAGHTHNVAGSIAASTTVVTAGVSGTGANNPLYYALAYIMKT